MRPILAIFLSGLPFHNPEALEVSQLRWFSLAAPVHRVLRLAFSETIVTWLALGRHAARPIDFPVCRQRARWAIDNQNERT
jgi:hypothetical protein